MCRSVSAAKGVDASVIGVGSVYGGSGYDLEYIFRALWTDRMLKVETPLQGENYVPMVHVDALGALLLQRVSSGAGGTANTYVAAVDGYSGTIGSFLKSIAAAYDATVDFLPTRVKVIDDIMTSPANALWNQNMLFKSPAATADADPASGSTVDARALWEEFLRGNDLTPCTMVVAGPPAPFKSDLCKAVSRHLSLAHVTVTSAVEFIKAHVELESGPMLSEKETDAAAAPAAADTAAESPTEGEAAAAAAAAAVPKSALGQLQDALSAELEAAYVPAKGGPTYDFATIAVTSELALKLTPELLRRCVAAQLEASRKGYCLDLWTADLGTSVEDLQSFCPRTVLPAVSAVGVAATGKGAEGKTLTADADAPASNAPPVTDAAAAAPAAEGEEIAVAEVAPEVQYSYSLPQVVMEVQAGAEEMVAAWAAAAGIDTTNPKLGKEEAASLADVKGKVDAYTAALVDIPMPAVSEVKEGDEAVKAAGETPGAVSAAEAVAEAETETEVAPQVAAYLRTSHTGVLAMAEAGTYAVARVDAVAAAFDVAALAVTVGEKVLAARGPVGWALEHPLEPQPEPEVEIEAEAPIPVTAAAVEETPATEATVPALPAPTSTPTPESAAAASAPNAAAALAGLDPKKRAALLSKTARLEEYLVSNIGTHLAEVMVAIERERPEDPLAYLISFLESRSRELEVVGEQAARDRFEAVLAQATALSGARDTQ
jgi:hypothetical protein